MGRVAEFSSRVALCPEGVWENLKRIQALANSDPTFVGVWASGCLSRATGIIDVCGEIETLIEFCIQHSDSVYEGLVAFARASYSYDNLLGMTHNLLDNIGFLYGIQVYGKAFSDYKAKSFHELFNSNTKKLTTLSKDPALNSELEALYGVAFSYTESNNKYKHKFWPGLVHLLQPEWIIRSIPSIAQNLITHLDLGSVSLPDALNHVKAIRESVLPATLRIVLALGSYD